MYGHIIEPRRSVVPDFIAAVTCIDGRFHEPLVAWARRRDGAAWVDLVTAPGIAAQLAAGAPDATDEVVRELRPSLEAHGSATVVVAAHEGCAGDPSPPAAQRAALPEAAHVLHARLGGVAKVRAVHLSAAGEVEEVATLPPIVVAPA
jgi:hypothetical protein